MKTTDFLECGKIINTHGVRGGLKLESWCNTPADLASLKRVLLKKGSEYVCHKVKRASVFKQFVLFELEGITDIPWPGNASVTVVDYDDEGQFHIVLESYDEHLKKAGLAPA